MDAVTRGAVRVGLATAAWCAAHSLLASHPAKGVAERMLGTRTRNGLYRSGYNAVALVTFGMLIRFIRRQPGRTLHHTNGPATLLMRLAQAGGLLYATWGVFQVGIGGLSGLPHLLAWLTGERHIAPEPEGQTPPPRKASGSGAPLGSPFALTRQALNFFLLPLLWLNPQITSRLAAFNVVATLYLYVGSVHSEHRLRTTYGPAYDGAYRRRGVPFFLPRLGRRHVRAHRMARVAPS